MIQDLEVCHECKNINMEVVILTNNLLVKVLYIQISIFVYPIIQLTTAGIFIYPNNTYVYELLLNMKYTLWQKMIKFALCIKLDV